MIVAQRICLVEGCERAVTARGLCGPHYMKQKRASGFEGFPSRQERNNGICILEDCCNRVHAREMCARHYREWLAEKNGSRQCPRPGCSSLAVLDGLCMRHYSQRKRKDDLQELRGARRCSVDGCDRPYDANGLCQLHYQRLRMMGSPGPATLLRRQNGSGYIDTNGYRILTQAGGRKVSEQRVVMERMLGRPLMDDENVHHVNGVRDDNRPANLELWSTSQPSGQRVEDKLAWAREFITRYGDDFVQPRLLR